MDPALLRTFVVSAEELHFAHAAKKLDVPRSAVIAAIRKLEEILGYDLFDKSAPTTVLTVAGVAFLTDAKSQLSRSAAAAKASVAAPGGKAKASKGKGRAPAVKGVPRVGKRRQSR